MIYVCNIPVNQGICIQVLYLVAAPSVLPINILHLLLVSWLMLAPLQHLRYHCLILKQLEACIVRPLLHLSCFEKKKANE